MPVVNMPLTPWVTALCAPDSESGKFEAKPIEYQARDNKKSKFKPEGLQISYYPPTGEILSFDVVKVNTSEKKGRLKKLQTLSSETALQ